MSRTRNHIIEDESRVQFKMLLPGEWVVRDKPNDYGIDCEVEIFDKNGAPTGYVFWVQLKATDATDKSTQTSFIVSQQKLRQLCDYKLPVLFVRYISNKKQFYIRWAKSTALLNSNNSNKNVRVTFNEADLWSDNTANQLLYYLQKSHSIGEGDINLPLTTYIEFDAESIDIVHLFNIRAFFSGYKQFINVSKEKDDAELTINLSAERLLLSLMDQKGASFELGYGKKKNFSFENVGQLVLTGVLIIFANLNRYDLFSQLLEKIDLKKIIMAIPQIKDFLIPHILHSEPSEKNLQLAFEVIDQSQNPEANPFTAISLLKLRLSGNDVANKAIVNYYERQVEKFQIQGNKKATGLAYYNLANLYRQKNEYLKTINYLNKARKEYVEYLSINYFLSELGGVLFDAGRFKLSCQYYRKAIAVDSSNPFIHALFGDALLFSGEYELAAKQFDYFLKNAKDVRAVHEFQLKYSCIATLIQNGYPTQQKRHPNQAVALATFDNTMSTDVYDEKLHQALDNDLLCSLAWFNLGQVYAMKNNYLSSFLSFLMSSILNRWDVISWVNALIMCFNNSQTDRLLTHIVNSAYYYCGDEFLIQLSNQVNQSDPTFHSRLLKLIDNLLEEREKQPQEIRFVGDNGEFARIIL